MAFLLNFVCLDHSTVFEKVLLLFFKKKCSFIDLLLEKRKRKLLFGKLCNLLFRMIMLHTLSGRFFLFFWRERQFFLAFDSFARQCHARLILESSSNKAQKKTCNYICRAVLKLKNFFQKYIVENQISENILCQ